MRMAFFCYYLKIKARRCSGLYAFYDSDLSVSKPGFKVSIQCFKKLFSIQVMFGFYVISVNAYCKVFGHLTAFHRFNTYLLQGFTEFYQLLVVVEFSSECQASGPCKNRSNRVGRSRFSLLVCTIVTGYGTVSSFS